MIDIILILIIAVIVLAAGGYVYRAKRHGVKCVGCPIARTCAVKDAVAGKAAGNTRSACCGEASQQGAFRKTARLGNDAGFRRTNATPDDHASSLVTA